MHFNHTLYDEARNKLDETGISERVKDLEGKPPVHYSVFDRVDLECYVQEMSRRGFFKDDTSFKEMFYNQLYTRGEKYSPYRKLMENVENSNSPEWQVEHSEGRIYEDFDKNNDSQIVLGYLASQVLTPDEFWNPERFGFDNVSDLWGSVGTLIKNEDSSAFGDRGYCWNSSDNGKNFSTEVTASIDGDFRLIRTDITNYKTIDPVGKEVSYRPVLKEDEQLVAAYHSVETSLLSSILKWANQERFSINAFENTEKFLEQFKDREKYLGNFGEAGMYNDLEITMSFTGAGIPLARLDEESRQVNGPTVDGLFVDAERGHYQIALDSNGDLAFCYAGRSPSLLIPKEEANELVYGLFEQARRGLGRTSFSKLESALRFTKTEEYEEIRKK